MALDDHVRFAVGVPNVGPYADPEAQLALSTAAEGAGWDGYFLWDHILYPEDWPVLDPWVALSAIAARTNRLVLGLLVAGLARALPWEVAKRAASLDRLSGGRLILGAGLGSRPEEFTAFGQPADPRGRAERLDEALEVIDGLWSGAPYSFQGKHFTIASPPMHPVPLQRPRIPIWVGGRWPNRPPFRRAARWDGVVPTHASYGKGKTMPPDDLRELVAFVQRQRGGDRSFDVALEGRTPEGAEGWRVVEPYRAAGLTWWIEALGWWRGDVSTALGRVRSGPPSVS